MMMYPMFLDSGPMGLSGLLCVYCAGFVIVGAVMIGRASEAFRDGVRKSWLWSVMRLAGVVFWPVWIIVGFFAFLTAIVYPKAFRDV